MPTYYRAQASLSNDTGLERDRTVNTFHIKSSGLIQSPDDIADIGTTLQAFYFDIGTLFSANAGNELRVTIYNMLQAPPRLPIGEQLHSFTPATAGPSLPNEVAICLSYRGALVAGLNRRRNMGRIYLGPVAGAAIADETGDMRVTQAAMSQIASAATTRLMPFQSPVSSESLEWCVFSRSNALGLDVGEPFPSEEPDYTADQLDAGYRPIVLAWVDNALDTQRRRGHRSTVRTEVS